MKKIEDEFWLPVELLKKLSDDIELMIRKGLQDESTSFIKMLVSYVDSLPSGYFFLFLSKILLFFLILMLNCFGNQKRMARTLRYNYEYYDE